MKAAINGLGRIGRLVLKIALEKGIDVVAVNDLCDVKTLAYLLKYDSVYGNYDKKAEAGKDFLKIDGKTIKVFQEREPEKLPWKKLNVDVVVESTGFFEEEGYKHLKAGEKKVIISAPAKNCEATIVPGVNEEKLKKNYRVISMGSCTTNCLAPLAKVLDDNFGIKKAFMTTVHAYTADQMLVDGPHRDLRRARSAAINVVPTTTGAAIAAALTVPEIKDKFDGLSIRVPVPVGSISDITMLLSREATVDEINRTIMDECEDPRWRGIVTYTTDPIVSSDIIGNPNSSIADLSLTQVIDKNLAKIVAWYDNEWAYSCRLVEQTLYLGAMIEK